MIKYRALTLDELNELQKEFVEYLVLNGITAPDWEKLKKENKESAEGIVEQFSNVVFESIMRKVQFLEAMEKKEVRAFQCLADRIVMVGMKAEGQEVDFTNSAFIQQAAVNPPKGLAVYTTEKKYAIQRELELFAMVQNGCTIADGKLFKALSLSLAANH